MTQGWPVTLGALVIGGIATLYPLLTGRTLGVSSVYASLSEKATPAEADLDELEAQLMAATLAEFGEQGAPPEAPTLMERLARLRAESERVRGVFLLGLVAGAAAMAVASGTMRFDLTLGQSFDARYGSFGPLSVAVLLLGGILIGVGTRICAGCTSGHGITGVARGEKGSLLTTSVFWGTALAVAWVFALT